MPQGIRGFFILQDSCNNVVIFLQNALQDSCNLELRTGGGYSVGRPVRTVISVDDATGEVKSMSTVYVSAPQSEPPYLKLYLDGLFGLRKVPMYCWPVLLWLLGRIPYANSEQCFEFGTPMRQRAAGELGVKISQVNHAVSDLVKSGVILRAGRGLYQFNPMFFARGEWKDIQKLRSSGGQIS